MILSDEVSFPEVIKSLAKAEQEIGRSINPTIYSVAEWWRKLLDEGGFLSRVAAQPKIFLIGSDDDLMRVLHYPA